MNARFRQQEDPEGERKEPPPEKPNARINEAIRRVTGLFPEPKSETKG